MRKLARLLLWSSTAVAALLGGLVALLFFVDVDIFRGQLERQVSAALGREVVFEGPLSLEPSLTPRVTIRGVKIANPSWASRPHLASVDDFGIRVGLLPLLDRRLEINALEFVGVDLFVEVNKAGENNLGTDRPTGSTGETPAPVIEAISLRDLKIGYRVPDLPTRSFVIERVTGRVVPGEPLELKALSTVNKVPIALTLQAEPIDSEQIGPAWNATLLGEIGRLSIRIQGNVADPTDWDRGRYQVHVEGPDLDDLETLSGQELPDTESYELDASVGFDLDDYIEVREFSARIGDTDLQGTLDWDVDAPRPAIKMRLHSQRLDIEDLGFDDTADDKESWSVDDYLALPLDPSLFAGVDLDVAIEVDQLDGLTDPVRDINLELYANDQNVRLGARASQANIQIMANAGLPWGERLTALGLVSLDLRTLLGHTVLQGHAEPTDNARLYQADLEDPAPDLAVTRIEATIAPDEPVTLRAAGQINKRAVEAQLQAPLGQLLQAPLGPWQGLEFALGGEGMRVGISGSVGKPFELGGLDLRFKLQGDDLTDLLTIPGRVVLTGRYQDQPDARALEDLRLTIGDSELRGGILVQGDGPHPRIVARLTSDRLQLDQLLPTDSGPGVGQRGGGFDLGQPLQIGDVGLHPLDIALRVGRLEGAGLPVTDLLIEARSAGDRLVVEPLRVTLDDSPLAASLTLPWGRRLTSLGNGGISIERLSRFAEVNARADVAAEKLGFQSHLLGRDFAVELIAVEARAEPGEGLRLLADARLGNQPFEARLNAEPLEQLLQRPKGPWNDLDLQLVAGDTRFAAQGTVERPLEGAGFDLRYELRGAEIDKLLPLFDLILPLEGAYTASGHFTDSPDQILLDDIKIVSGQSDIAGQVIVHRGKERPRVDARLESDQIYLRELIPIDETADAGAQRKRAIPDYELPIENMRAYDGELVFKAKQLGTKFGNFGYMNLRASLQNGVLRIAPFRVHGWGGALVTIDLNIDATADPPQVTSSLLADDLDYGLLLRQAGVAEIVEGTLDMTLSLSGAGRTRREFLADADGQLIIVGTDGRVASRRLDLWGAGLVTTMLSPSWRAADVTELNCLLFRATIGDGIVTSDELLVDTQRITIGAAGTLDLETEALDLVFAPRPKRASLLSLTNPVRVTGTLLKPEVSVTVLPVGRTAAAGGGLVAGLLNPAFLVFMLADTGSDDANPCLEAVDAARAAKAEARGSEPLPEPPAQKAPARSISPFPGCSPLGRR